MTAHASVQAKDEKTRVFNYNDEKCEFTNMFFLSGCIDPKIYCQLVDAVKTS